VGFAVNFTTAKLPVIEAFFVMQNIANHHIANGFNCFFPHPVTSPCFGNNPANGLVTESLQ
jgi:hypothetical protein